MDKHICKAKTIDTGEWVYGYYVAIPDEYSYGKDICHAIFTSECEHICMGEYKDYGWYEVNPDTVCRCVGIKDNNGTIIFEHDIVGHLLFGNVAVHEVIFRDGGFYLGSFPIEYFNSKRIHGNKFDNTELMEE